ncbi:uncharacterized protein LOC134830509 [Culicoides brevitarsis]|uniref:uncharacterized protein LOC134830509 n=1 Tax=Culicoides brevitarsis TaxID=469753 RepID=UPI00307B2829
MTYFPLNLNWTIIRSLRQILDFEIFQYKDEQRDNFTFMLSELCLDPPMMSTRVFSLLSDLFAVATSSVSEVQMGSNFHEKLEKNLLELQSSMTDDERKALEICLEAISMETPEIFFKYLTGILLGLKVDAFFAQNELLKGNLACCEMFQLLYEQKFVDSFDLTDVILEHCLQILELDTKSQFVAQIEYFLNFTKHLLDTSTVGDDIIDGAKYQKLRKLWHVIFVLNEGRLLEKAWKEFGMKNENFVKVIKLEGVNFDEMSPEMLSHKEFSNPEDFLERKKLLEQHSQKFEYDPRIKEVLTEVQNYAQKAYEATKT